jgi:hypothetical protein
VGRAKQYAKQFLMVTSVLVLVGLAVKVTMPKAVHAAVAALVQIANTPANPVPAAEVTQSASQLVTLECSTFFRSQACGLSKPNGEQLSVNYIVPDGQNLVITDVEITSDVTGAGICQFGIFPPNGALDKVWTIPSDGVTHLFSYHHGFVSPAGGEVKPFFTCTPSLGAPEMQAIVRGYLTPN